MIGRTSQVAQMKALLESARSEFLAVTGRRRVGKTYLVDQVYKDFICFRLTGIQDGSLTEQLVNFGVKLAEYSEAPYVIPPKNWQQAFIYLKGYLRTLSDRKKQVIFLDELPWISTPRSGFLQMLAHFWNDYMSKENHFILVICGSSTSWITQKIVNDKGGLHNRLTQNIMLKPFTLREVKALLQSKQIGLTDNSIVELYMALGGIPYYLENIRRGESVPAAIERLCFAADGLLRNEYDNLYKALFNDAADHESIVASLALANDGMTRSEIIKKSKVRPGGPYNRAMEDLIQSGFVLDYTPFARKKKGSVYKLCDEYSVFYHRFIKPNRKYTKDIWLQLSATQSYKVWCGYAFEAVCQKHTQGIKDKLGIGSVYTEVSCLRMEGDKTDDGFQIDLILDRKDNTINLCEIKFYSGPFTIDKKYAFQLITRKQKFMEYTQTQKQVFITFITNYGLKQNEYTTQIADSEVVLTDLF